MRINVDITTRGAMFTAAARPIVDRNVDMAAGTLADEAAERIRNRLRSVLKNPTGRYESSIRTRRDGAVAEVTDSGIIYGPWLEGVSSRNTRSRFKGYATFRRVEDSMRVDAAQVVKRDADRLARELS